MGLLAKLASESIGYANSATPRELSDMLAVDPTSMEQEPIYRSRLLAVVASFTLDD